MEIKQCSPEWALNDHWVKEKIKGKIKDFLKLDKNDHTIYQNLWDTKKAMLRGKFIALNAYIKRLGNSDTSELTEHLKTSEQKEANSPKRTRRQ